jgi:hypothetical protein
MIRRWIIRWLARRDQPQEFVFPRALRDARRVLVFMPSETDAFRQAEYFLSRLPQAFERAKVTLLYPPKSLAPRFYNPHGFQVIVPEDKQVWWWGLPRRAFLAKLFEQSCDVLITLDKEPSVFFAAVSVASGTPVRIGLPDGMGRPFVTIELRHGRQSADARTEFILFVEMIRKLAITPAGSTVTAPPAARLRPA